MPDARTDATVPQAACAVDDVSLMTKTIAYISMPVVFVCLVSLAFGVVHLVTRINAWRDRRQARRDSLAEPPEHQYTAKLTAKLNVCIHGEDLARARVRVRLRLRVGVRSRVRVMHSR